MIFGSRFSYTAKLRMFVWIVVGLLGILVFIGLFGPGADMLARRDVHTVKGMSEEEESQQLRLARDAARGRFIQIATGVLALGALIYTARNFSLLRRQTQLNWQATEISEKNLQLAQGQMQHQAEINRRTLDLAVQGQVTDRYMKTVEQLSSDVIEVRLGAIFAFERIARDSAADHPAVMEVLCAFVRERSATHRKNSDDNSIDSPTVDIQMAMAVIGRRNVDNDARRLDLRLANLRGIELQDADLSNAYMRCVNLSRSSLHRVKFPAANLSRTTFADSHVVDVDFTGADLSDYTVMSDCELIRVDLTRAYLEELDMENSRLIHMDVSEVDFGVVNLSGVDLRETHGLTPRNLLSALIDVSTHLPYHLEWNPDTHSVVEVEL